MDSVEQLKTEIEQEQATLAEHEAQLKKLTVDEPTVWLRHPNTGDVQQVPATPERLVPLMGRGYQQIHAGSTGQQESK